MREIIHPLDTAVATPDDQKEKLIRYINLKLGALGQPVSRATADPYFLELTRPLLRNYLVRDQMQGGHLCPADQRIDAYLREVLGETCPDGVPGLPPHTFVLDRVGLARVMSLPPVRGPLFVALSGFVPRARRGCCTIRGATGGRRREFSTSSRAASRFRRIRLRCQARRSRRLLARALRPPEDVLRLPFTADQPDQARLFVSLLLRPLVCPAAGADPAKTHGDPIFRSRQPGQQSGLRGEHLRQCGRSVPAGERCRAGRHALDGAHRLRDPGAAPGGHAKKDLGLPHYERGHRAPKARRDVLARRGEFYNDGGAFKIACRDKRGVMVTIIADNYYGYCKKEVKTQISFAANLFGFVEEEHAGGAIAFPSYVLGQDFYADRTVPLKAATFDDALRLLGDLVEAKPDGYAVDRHYPNVFYVPENAEFSVRRGISCWQQDGVERRFRCGRAMSTCCHPATGSGSRSRWRGRRGGWWHSRGRDALPQALDCFRRR